MIINNARFELTAVKPEQYPASSIPEVALVGRSNVGKSSLINSMLNRKNLARVSSAPGKTREINFYNVDDKLYIVDLPGYGYAGVSKTKKSSWSEVVDTYLTTRKQLSLIIMIVDIRHSPTDDDKLMYEWLLGTNALHIVVASKSDKISRSQIKPRLDEIRKTLGMADEIILASYSSETKQGRDELWSEIEYALKIEGK